jgi:hypothetical protein
MILSSTASAQSRASAATNPESDVEALLDVVDLGLHEGKGDIGMRAHGVQRDILHGDVVTVALLLQHRAQQVRAAEVVAVHQRTLHTYIHTYIHTSIILYV